MHSAAASALDAMAAQYIRENVSRAATRLSWRALFAVETKVRIGERRNVVSSVHFYVCTAPSRNQLPAVRVLALRVLCGVCRIVSPQLLPERSIWSCRADCLLSRAPLPPLPRHKTSHRLTRVTRPCDLSLPALRTPQPRRWRLLLCLPCCCLSPRARARTTFLRQISSAPTASPGSPLMVSMSLSLPLAM